MANGVRIKLVAGCLLLMGLAACQPDFVAVKSTIPDVPDVTVTTVNYRIKRKTTTGNCYTNKSTDYEYVKDQLVARAVVTGSDRGAGPPLMLYTYDANGRLATSTEQLPVPAADGVSAYATAYNYSGATTEVRTDVIRGGKVDNTNYNLPITRYTIDNGITVAATQENNEQDGRLTKALYTYTYANGNLTSWTIFTKNGTEKATEFTYTYDTNPNPFKGRGLPVPSYLNGRNNVVSITTKSSGDPKSYVNTIQYTYNEKNYPVTMLDGNGCSTQYEYESY